MTNFDLVAQMNEAFGNPKGNPQNIDWERVQKQCLNIFDEAFELMAALGADPANMKKMASTMKANIVFVNKPHLKDTRDALCDVRVFALGGHHLMGIDANRDMESVIDGVMSRFVKDAEDLEATVLLHGGKGVKDVYVEGNYPRLILKSASDQPDAPKGKFLKSASYSEPIFYDVES